MPAVCRSGQADATLTGFLSLSTKVEPSGRFGIICDIIFYNLTAVPVGVRKENGFGYPKASNHNHGVSSELEHSRRRINFPSSPGDSVVCSFPRPITNVYPLILAKEVLENCSMSRFLLYEDVDPKGP